jgi:hypothetical protein
VSELTTTGGQRAPSRWLQPIPSREGKDSMTILYERLEAKYPRLWEQSFRGAGSIQNWKEEWAATFELEGITPAEIKTGLDCVTRRHPDYPPTEGQFLNCCRPPIDHELAFAEAVKQLHFRERGEDTWSHPAIYWAAVRVGTFDVINGSWRNIQGRWKAALDAALSDRPYVPVPPPRLALPAPAPTKISEEEAAQNFQMMRDIIAGVTKRVVVKKPDAKKKPDGEARP